MNKFKSKKGITEIFINVMGLAFIAFVFLFMFLFIKNIFTVELIPEFENASINVLRDNGNDTVLISLIQQQNTNLQNVDFKVDLLFLGLWIGGTLIGAIAAAAYRKLNILEFLTTIFLGIILLLLGLNYIDQIFTWLVQSFINDTFSASETYLPIFSFYVDNFLLINILTFISFLLINQLTRNEEESLTSDIEEEGSFQSINERGDEQ